MSLFAVRAFFRALHRSTRGASMIEYIAIVGVVALFAMTAYQRFGTTLYSKSKTFGDNVRTLTPVQGGSTYCFVAGTQVGTAGGLRSIESIHTGDVVLSRDEGTSELVLARVGKTFVTPDAPIVRVQLREQFEPIRATPGHPFFTADRGWIAAESLVPGEPVLTAGGDATHVAAVERLTERATVYNFEVEDSHTYFVGSSLAWVHNPVDCNGSPIPSPAPAPPAPPGGATCTSGNCQNGTTCFVAGTEVATPSGPRPIEEIRAGDEVLSGDEDSGQLVVRHVTATFVTPDHMLVDVRLRNHDAPIRATPGHRFFSRDRGWVTAETLAPGEPLIDTEGREIQVEYVRVIPQRETVFNFEVEGTHTYFVGDAHVWVHNPITNYPDGKQGITLNNPGHTVILELADDPPPPGKQVIGPAADKYAHNYPGATRLHWYNLDPKDPRYQPGALANAGDVVIVTHGAPGEVQWGVDANQTWLTGAQVATQMQNAGYNPQGVPGVNNPEVHVMACNSATKPCLVRWPGKKPSVAQDISNNLNLDTTGSKADHRIPSVLHNSTGLPVPNGESGETQTMGGTVSAIPGPGDGRYSTTTPQWGTTWFAPVTEEVTTGSLQSCSPQP